MIFEHYAYINLHHGANLRLSGLPSANRYEVIFQPYNKRHFTHELVLKTSTAKFKTGRKVWVCIAVGVCGKDWSSYGKTGREEVLRTNRPFPSSLDRLFQSESKCETILMKMICICMKMKLHTELIYMKGFALWNRGTRELAEMAYYRRTSLNEHLYITNTVLFFLEKHRSYNLCLYSTCTSITRKTTSVSHSLDVRIKEVQLHTKI